MQTNQINDPVVEEKHMDMTQETEEPVIAKKSGSILDTRMAIRPFKTCPDGLEAFVMACNRKKTGVRTPEIFGIHFKRAVNNKSLNPPQVDHLAFVKYYDITMKCKQERVVSTLFTCEH